MSSRRVKRRAQDPTVRELNTHEAVVARLNQILAAAFEDRLAAIDYGSPDSPKYMLCLASAVTGDIYYTPVAQLLLSDAPIDTPLS